MAQAGYDFFTTEAYCGEDRKCRICGSDCLLAQDMFGPTGVVSAMANGFAYHDEFMCPHTDKAWHKQALKLAVALDKNPSTRIAEFMKADLEDLLHKNLC